MKRAREERTTEHRLADRVLVQIVSRSAKQRMHHRPALRLALDFVPVLAKPHAVRDPFCPKHNELAAALCG
jgi:hypothetical protein